tara:strand:- start:104 stop:493 length:390 start_codon:yes stop_codon:yes gene_type:complete
LEEDTVEDEMLIYFSWFVAGAITHKALSYLLALGGSINLFNQTLNGCLIMLNKIDEQKLLTLKQKYDKLEKSKTDDEEEEFKQERAMDLNNHYLWREMMIGIILVCCPSSIKSSLNFKDWASAMKLLEK